MHHFYPTYDDRIVTAPPLNDLLAALGLLTDDGSGRKWFITAGARFRKNSPPHILHEHFYNRTGEFAGADLIRLSPEVAAELERYTAGLAYLGGTDETIRYLRDNQRYWNRLVEKAEDLKKHLKPGVGPDCHGWSSQYKFIGGVFTSHKSVGAGTSGIGYVEVVIGVRFKNPLNEEWFVLFDGRVFTPEQFKMAVPSKHKQFFDENFAERTAIAT
ncbi:hypothetical protein KC887_06340 [Candidatus Kaiserbacteria bacterium]|nr:hypothetical protein [Candidatus Kaiserbacteria bacterium]